MPLDERLKAAETVVHFDQLSVARSTQKLIEIHKKRQILSCFQSVTLAAKKMMPKAELTAVKRRWCEGALMGNNK